MDKIELFDVFELFEVIIIIEIKNLCIKQSQSIDSCRPTV